MIALLLLALDEPRAAGAINGTAPAPVTMRDLCRAIGRALHRPSWLPAPALALRALYGEGATAVLSGQRVVPRRAQELGFQFQFPSLEPALQEIFARQ
jgi:NAD dependent epimerase/dehydratase family enzyme